MAFNSFDRGKGAYKGKGRIKESICHNLPMLRRALLLKVKTALLDPQRRQKSTASCDDAWLRDQGGWAKWCEEPEIYYQEKIGTHGIILLNVTMLFGQTRPQQREKILPLLRRRC